MNKPSEYVTEMFHKLREDISEIKHRLFTEKTKLESADNPRHYTIDARHKNTDPDQEDDESKSMRATLNLPPTIRVDAQTEERHKPLVDDRGALLQIGGIGVGIIVAIIYGWQLHAMLEANKLGNRSFVAAQRAYVTLGRKDGAIGEFRKSDDPTMQDGLVIFFQNSGHVPAKFHWGLTEWFIDPKNLLSGTNGFAPMSKTRNKKTGDVTETGSTDGNIGGESVREVAVGYLPPLFVDSLFKTNEVFKVNGTYEYCDELGTYSCRTFSLAYQHLPFKSFRLMREQEHQHQ